MAGLGMSLMPDKASSSAVSRTGLGVIGINAKLSDSLVDVSSTQEHFASYRYWKEPWAISQDSSMSYYTPMLNDTQNPGKHILVTSTQIQGMLFPKTRALARKH